MRLLEDSKKDLFDAVLVKDISRFARNTLDFLTGIRTLKSNGTDVIFIGANHKVLGESEFVLTLFAALAQEESCALSKRIIFGKKQGAKRGRVPNIIYGYDKVDTYSLSVNEKEAEIVRMIFNWYTKENMGLRRISARLNEQSTPTKLGGRWDPKTVKRILVNPVYKGILVNNKSETMDFILEKRRVIPEEERYYHVKEELAVVDDEVFDEAQEIMKGRRVKEPNPKGCLQG